MVLASTWFEGDELAWNLRTRVSRMSAYTAQVGRRGHAHAEAERPQLN